MNKKKEEFKLMIRHKLQQAKNRIENIVISRIEIDGEPIDGELRKIQYEIYEITSELEVLQRDIWSQDCQNRAFQEAEKIAQALQGKDIQPIGLEVLGHRFTWRPDGFKHVEGSSDFEIPF